MSTPSHPEAPTTVAPPPARPPLRRSTDDRVLGGVCAGIARHLGVDPLLVRGAAVLLGLLAGAGILAYAAALLLIEADGAPVGERSRAGTVIGAGLLVVAGLVALAIGGGPLLGLVAAGFGLLVVLGLAAVAGLVTWWVGGGSLSATRRFGLVRPAVLGLVLLAGLLALAGGAFWLAGLTSPVTGAVLVVVVGALVVIAALLGRGRAALLPAFAVALPVAFVLGAGIDLDGGVGARNYRPAALADVAPSYALGLGHLTVDLRDTDLDRPGVRRTVAVRLGVGQATVIVPDGACVAGRSRLGLGYSDLAGGGGSGGIDVDESTGDGARPRGGRLTLDARVGTGAVQVLTSSQAAELGIGPFPDHTPAKVARAVCA